MNYHAPRLDDNHSATVTALEADGWSVLSLASFGCHVDLLCCDQSMDRSRGLRPVHWLCEVKDGAKRPSARRLKPATAKLMARWPGPGAVSCSPGAALAAGKAARLWDLEGCAVAAARYRDETEPGWR